MAFDLYHQPLDNSWRQAGIVASAALAPHCKRGKAPAPDDFVPKARLPQTPEEMAAELGKLKLLTGAINGNRSRHEFQDDRQHRQVPGEHG